MTLIPEYYFKFKETLTNITELCKLIVLTTCTIQDLRFSVNLKWHKEKVLVISIVLAMAFGCIINGCCNNTISFVTI